MSPNYFSPFTYGWLVKAFSMTLTQSELNSGPLAINVGLARRLKVNLAGGNPAFVWTVLTVVYLTMVYLTLWASFRNFPLLIRPMMKAKKNPLHRV
jgi:hypothetical protein